MPFPPIQLTHLDAVASATVVARNLHIAASFTTGSPANAVKRWGGVAGSHEATCLLHARSVVHHGPRGLNLYGSLCILKLHPLKVCDGLSKLKSRRAE
jgi:hypothetical protein